jgi:hypothetical protein
MYLKERPVPTRHLHALIFNVGWLLPSFAVQSKPLINIEPAMIGTMELKMMERLTTPAPGHDSKEANRRDIYSSNGYRVQQSPGQFSSPNLVRTPGGIDFPRFSPSLELVVKPPGP